jgi:hypothetical protein
MKPGHRTASAGPDQAADALSLSAVIIRSEAMPMKKPALVVITALFAILLYGLPVRAQEAEHEEHGSTPAHEAHEEEQGEAAEHEEHGEEHGGRPHHANDFAVFLGATDEHGHDTEFTWGLDYRRMIADRWAVGGLFDYAGGELRNAILAATVTWFPVGGLQLLAGPGIEFHRGRGSSEGGCGCAAAFKSDESEGHGESDEDATYFVFRLGVGWGFPIGQHYAITPQINLDLVDGERVWVYGLNFAYAW